MVDLFKKLVDNLGKPGALGLVIGLASLSIPDDVLISGHKRLLPNAVATAASVISAVITAWILPKRLTVRRTVVWAGIGALCAVVFLVICISINGTLGVTFFPGPQATFVWRFLWKASYVLMFASLGSLGWTLCRMAGALKARDGE